MKNIFLLSFILCLTVCSCLDNDDISGNVDVFDKPTIKNDGGPLDQKIVSLYEKYNTYFKYEFEESEYRWNWTSKEIEDYTAADVNKAEEVIDTIVNSVYKIFPESFSQRYLAYKVLLVDSLYLNGSSVEMIDYDNGVNYIIIANVSDRFDDMDKDGLKFEYLSLFVEEFFSKMPYPAEFSEVSREAYALYSIRWKDPNNYAFLRRDRNTDNKPPTVAQDFGDYVAMIVNKTQEEKGALFAKNLDIKKKMNLVVKYFKDNFNITLPTVE